MFRLRNFPLHERGSNLGPLAPEASVLTTELPRLTSPGHRINGDLLISLTKPNSDSYCRLRVFLKSLMSDVSAEKKFGVN